MVWNSKFLHEHSTEDLLKSLDKPSESFIQVPPSYKQPIVKFITDYKIQEGEYAIKAFILYRLFKHSMNTKINYDDFNIFLRKVLPYNKNVFFINKSLFNVTEALYTKCQEKEKNVLKSLNRRFKKFLDDHNIKEGNIFITMNEFYYFLKKDKTRRRIQRKTFEKLCKLTFETKELTENVFSFGINQQLNFTEEDILRIRAMNEKEKADKKRSSKVPGPRSRFKP